ncbi:DUF2000 domain-containing protein [Homoserinibacter sp. YIM 151385]|uniref:DUF2000 domain-containing protein n=1 Tax=Homoserinibacter sp. YIM 151385 TaxID=2985506 RepID=UPI0022F00743|nr:DUF2000 domain-containing protein [Homoserinibacter sp. YIM 151385]WBU37416.1 DUF2000 domain-containing protein [Homoserinibacter sp. YIM 151385]
MIEQHDPAAEVRFDTRIAVLLRDDLEPWQELNVAAFLVSGLTRPEIVGAPYLDADGIEYAPMIGQPILLYSADAATLAAVRAKSVERGLRPAVYTAELFGTGHDAANRAAVRAVPSGELDLVGVAVHGPRNAVDRMTKAARLHR